MGSSRWTGRWRKRLPVPYNLTMTKGSVHIAVNRHFVHYIVTSPVARDFRKWVRRLPFPDEEFFGSLNDNPQLGIPGSYRGRCSLSTV